MGETLEQFLAPEMAQKLASPFVPCARYYEAMDYLLYLEEDVAHRADRVDSFLTLLWHPTDDRVIGVKLKGFRFLFGRIKEILSPLGVELSNQQFLPLMTAIEAAATTVGTSMLAEAQKQRLEERYDRAREFVKTAKVSLSDLPLAS